MYFIVHRTEETFHDKRFKLEECAATAIALQEKIRDRIHKEYIEKIISICPQEFLESSKSFASLDYTTYKDDLKSLVKLNREMIKCVENYERAHCSFNQSLKEAVWLEDINNSTPSTFNSRLGSERMKYSCWRKF